MQVSSIKIVVKPLFAMFLISPFRLNRTFKTTKASLLAVNGETAEIVSETEEELILSYKFTIARDGKVSKVIS